MTQSNAGPQVITPSAQAGMDSLFGRSNVTQIFTGPYSGGSAPKLFENNNYPPSTLVPIHAAIPAHVAKCAPCQCRGETKDRALRTG